MIWLSSHNSLSKGLTLVIVRKFQVSNPNFLPTNVEIIRRYAIATHAKRADIKNVTCYFRPIGLLVSIIY